MDPTETLSRVLDTLHALGEATEKRPVSDSGNARDDAIHALEDLQGWLARGGFAPEVQTSINRFRDRLSRS